MNSSGESTGGGYAAGAVLYYAITGVEPNDTIWLMVPKIVALASVPEMIAAPPVITVIRGFWRIANCTRLSRNLNSKSALGIE